MEIRL